MGCDCLIKTQDNANLKKKVYCLTPARCQKFNRICVKHKIEDLVNGRNNADSSKVAKFIDI